MLKMLSMALLCGTLANAEEAKSSPFTAEQEKKLPEIIWQTLEANPEKMIAIVQKYSEDQQKAALKKIQEQVNAAKDQLSDPKKAIVIGKEDSAAKFVLFVDPNCPHCRKFETTLNQAAATLLEKGKIAILVRQWPILGAPSEEAATGLIAAYQEDAAKFKVLLGKMLDSEKHMDQKQLMELAKEAGFNTQKLEEAMMSNAVKAQLKDTDELAKKIGLEATPTSILVDKSGARLLQLTNKEELEKILAEVEKSL